MRLSFTARFAIFTLVFAIAGAASGAGKAIADRVQVGLVRLLERRLPRTDIESGAPITGIVALGGSPARIVEAMRLAALHPHARLVISGEDDYKAALAEGSTADPARTIIEAQAANTFENALYTRQLVTPKPGERWLLVTSAAHMPRAIGCFRRVGFPVEPWPIYDTPTWPGQVALIARHEWFGLIAYRVMGRTRELFPGGPAAASGRG